MRRANKKGRSVVKGPYVMLTHELLKTPAYRSLSTKARAVLVELIFHFNGRNNGHIRLSVRQAAARCGCSAKPANRALNELQERGFIKCRVKGSFGQKVGHASIWILTFHPYNNQLPTNDYRTWKPAPAAPKKQKPMVKTASPRCSERLQVLPKQDSVPSLGVRNNHGFAHSGEIPVVEKASHIDIYHRHTPNEEALQHISLLVPDGWSIQKAQSRSGTDRIPQHASPRPGADNDPDPEG